MHWPSLDPRVQWNGIWWARVSRGAQRWQPYIDIGLSSAPSIISRAAYLPWPQNNSSIAFHDDLWRCFRLELRKLSVTFLIHLADIEAKDIAVRFMLRLRIHCTVGSLMINTHAHINKHEHSFQVAVSEHQEETQTGWCEATLDMVIREDLSEEVLFKLSHKWQERAIC